ncbi:MAG TPA: hypothetical protein VJT09_02365 [Pyrinomonadaceae bacterium]|nr:hypothetical protein [Pyrinomonadaceae bacterium]
MSRSTINYLTRLFVLAVSIIFIGADLTVSAQNANSSTMQEDTSTQNSNASNMNANTTRGGRRRRRGRRRAASMSTGDAPMDMQLEPGQEVVTGRPVVPYTPGRCDPNVQEQTDLSGTYTGRVGYTDVVTAGDATLTISGNDFTLTNGSMTQEGRVVATTTCNYTAVTMMFGKGQTTAATGPQPSPVPVVSLRARRTGNGLMLETVPGEARQFSFSSTGGGHGGRMPRGRGGSKRGPSSPPVGIKPPTAMEHAH